MTLKNRQNGSIIVSILVITIFLTTFIFSLMVLANSNLVRARDRILLLQAQYAAESGSDTVVAALNAGDESYSGTGGSEIQLLETSTYRATYEVDVFPGSDTKERIVVSTGYVYAPKNTTTPRTKRTIEVLVKRSSLESAVSVMSRNIIDIHSGVKSVRARDVHINGFLRINKSTTEFIAENITVGDRNTGAEDCSIDGGKLTKPSTFYNSGQTKTSINVAYNNCTAPPGNISNSDFDVAANQSGIPIVQSTYIPWSEYMDGTYQNSPGGCSDWTTGASPRSIPSTGNTKKTHYPDSDPNIASSCGTNGDINLGSNTFTIKDHAHLRANLCANSACTPTFNNPDTTLKFIFVEGSINFDNLQTSSGSGPIVFVSYGSDPTGRANECPLGSAIYLGNSGTTIGPAVYLLANNGICLDKTRFGASPSLGGISGKNVYIATNPGTPFDLGLDPLFPVDEIPVDLSWKAVRYRRINP